MGHLRAGTKRNIIPDEAKLEPHGALLEAGGAEEVLWNASAAGGQQAQASLLETLRTMSARVLVEASLLEPFLRKKLAPGAALQDDAARAVRSSLEALARPTRQPHRPAAG